MLKRDPEPRQSAAKRTLQRTIALVLLVSVSMVLSGPQRRGLGWSAQALVGGEVLSVPPEQSTNRPARTSGVENEHLSGSNSEGQVVARAEKTPVLPLLTHMSEQQDRLESPLKPPERALGLRGSQMYEDEFYGLRFACPDGWHVTPPAYSVGGDHLIVSNFEPSSEDELPGGLAQGKAVYLVVEPNPQRLALDEWLARRRAVALPNQETILDETHGRISGYDMVKHQLEGYEGTALATYWANGDKVFVLNAAPATTQSRETYEHILSTLEIFSPAGRSWAGSATVLGGYSASPTTADSASDSLPDLKFPFPCGEAWAISQGYYGDDPGHPDDQWNKYALDFVNVSGEGTYKRPVLAAHGGQVVSRGWDTLGGGWTVKIDADGNSGGYVTFYAHLVTQSSLEAGTWVSQGQEIGRSDHTGTTYGATGDHIHFALWLNGQSVKPEPMSSKSGFRHGQRLVSDNCHLVQFYEHANYEGSYTYPGAEGSYNVPAGHNDQISSFVLKPGWCVKVFKHANLVEPSKYFGFSDYDFSDDTFDDQSPLNDEVSSITLSHSFAKGDGNCDRLVDDIDYVIWWGSFEQDRGADFNGDAVTDDLDYVIWWQNVEPLFSSQSISAPQLQDGQLGSVTLYVSPGSAVLEVGEAIQAEVWLHSTDPGAVVETSVIDFDDMHLQVEEINLESVFANEMTVTSPYEANEVGRITIKQGLTGSQRQPVVGTHRIATIGFRAIASTGYLSGDNVSFDEHSSEVASAEATWMKITTDGARYQVGDGSMPDLRPYAPAGYAHPVIPSSSAGTHEVDTLRAAEPTYFDWHFTNSGNAIASGGFHVELWVDQTKYMRYPYSEFHVGRIGGFDDWVATVPSPGYHGVRLVIDADDAVAESNEDNNEWFGIFYWQPSDSNVPIVYIPLVVRNP